MTKFFALALAAVTSTACAQTPATNPMPDGSRDMYVGLGVISGARYQGSHETERKALPVLQVQLSNGLFVSGMRAGVHLARSPQLEFGPLLEWQPRRDAGGEGAQLGGIGNARFSLVAMPLAASSDNRLSGMPVIHGRMQGGGFLNYYLTPAWRLTSSLLYGADNARDGMKLELGVQRLALALGPHHRIALDAGVSFANRRYNMAFFGVSEDDSYASGLPMFDAAGGLKDARLGARWNWAWSPSWMLTSSLQATRLLGSARLSPLVERPTNLTVSTAIAYRF
ncbi:MipA/OmpV family protein [Massilia litorea]|uniref:MipA/OmpV family protein n=1 Tax=Massilia litorea TaxID=2769491 RepID=A0A7L9U6A0_9BURK|nr:MipA/OmpV family protein [Massilia litorea]QOL49586.1 MipA/OmpV family protein [Massilia litorea]